MQLIRKYIHCWLSQFSVVKILRVITCPVLNSFENITVLLRRHSKLFRLSFV